MIYIFKIKLKSGYTQDDYVKAWKEGSEIIQKSKGAQGTKLFKSLDEPDTFIAIASWDSKQSRDEAMQELEEQSIEMKKLRSRHRDYGDIEVLGNFDQIASVETE